MNKSKQTTFSFLLDKSLKFHMFLRFTSNSITWWMVCIYIEFQSRALDSVAFLHVYNNLGCGRLSNKKLLEQWDEIATQSELCCMYVHCTQGVPKNCSPTYDTGIICSRNTLILGRLVSWVKHELSAIAKALAGQMWFLYPRIYIFKCCGDPLSVLSILSIS